MAVIADVLQFVLDSGGGASLAQVRRLFPMSGPALKLCLERGLLEIQGECYRTTGRAAGFLSASAVEAKRDMKRCPRCGLMKAVGEFWKDVHRTDGLTAYCIECSNERKREAMEQKQLEARELITDAAQQLVAAAAAWDAAVESLADAWRVVMSADEVLRVNRRPAGIDYDSGRMEARLLHQRASFTLNLALLDAQFPVSVHLIRECGMSPKLADFVGTDPQFDYFPAAPVAEGSTAAPEPRATRKARRASV